MEKLQIFKNSSLDWSPSAASPDASQVATARADGSLEIWLVSPGAVAWHCQLVIQGNPSSRVSSLVWCRLKDSRPGRLLSSSIDGVDIGVGSLLLAAEGMAPTITGLTLHLE